MVVSDNIDDWLLEVVGCIEPIAHLDLHWSKRFLVERKVAFQEKKVYPVEEIQGMDMRRMK
jgi:hypothetical protein